jgi:ribosomal protein S27AE
MDKNTFELADPIVNEIDEAITELLASAETEKVRSLLSQLNKAIGNRYTVNLVMDVDIFDKEQDRCLPLLQTGLTGFDTDEPFQVSGDSTPHRYIVGGEMLTVPHDRCPRCWNIWDFKFKHQKCDHCGATMGKDVKLLLDTDECPYCGEGEVSMSRPTCNQCGYIVDVNQVVWG